MTLDPALALAYAHQEQRRRRFERNQKLIAIAYPDGGVDAYVAAIAAAGNPPDQIANFERAGVILQPKQLEFAAWARRADSDDGPNEIGFGGARGGGKSLGLFVQAAIDDCQRFPGLKILYLRKIAKRAQEQMLDLIQATLQYTSHRYTAGQIIFPNGSKILIGHFNTEKEALAYLGIEYDEIIIEETTTLSEAAYKAIRLSARSSKGYRPRIYNSTNPLGIGHAWYKKRFIDPERRRLHTKRKFIFATVEDNLFVNDEYIESLNDLTGNLWRAYRKGDWDVTAGAYFTTWNHAVHVIPPLEQLLHEWEVWASMDYGYNHWNVVYLHCKTGDGIHYTFHELAHRFRHPDEIAVDIHTMLARYQLTVDDLQAFLAGGDVFAKTGVARQTVAQQYADAGITLHRAETSSRALSAQYLAKLLGNPDHDRMPTWYITENCPRLAESIPEVLVDPNNPEAPLKVDIAEDGSGGDDFFQCACYGLFRPVRSSID